MSWKDYLALGWLLFSCVACAGCGIFILTVIIREYIKGKDRR